MLPTMPSDQLILLAIGIFVVAVLSSSVGHAGASGYIALMSLFGLAPVFIKPVALVSSTKPKSKFLSIYPYPYFQLFKIEHGHGV
jgi:hypothetical protein